MRGNIFFINYNNFFLFLAFKTVEQDDRLFSDCEES